MGLIPWRPFGEISPLRKEIDNLLRNFLGQTHPPEPFTSEWLPVVDVSESEDSIRLKAELPGLDAKDTVRKRDYPFTSMSSPGDNLSSTAQ